MHLHFWSGSGRADIQNRQRDGLRVAGGYHCRQYGAPLWNVQLPVQSDGGGCYGGSVWGVDPTALYPGSDGPLETWFHHGVNRWETGFAEYQYPPMRLWRNDHRYNSGGYYRHGTVDMWWSGRPQVGRGEERLPEEPRVAQQAARNPSQSYRDQWELMEDLFTLIDYRLYLYYKGHEWLGPRSDLRNMLGLVVSREEFEHNLTKAAQTGLLQKLTPEEIQQIEFGEGAIRKRLENTQQTFPLQLLFRRFSLDEFQKAVVVLSYAASLDSKYERLFSYLQDDVTCKAPTVSLAVQLYLPLERTVEEYTAQFSRPGLFTSLFEREALAEGMLKLRPVVLEYLSAGMVASKEGLKLFDGANQEPEAPLVVGAALEEELEAYFDAAQAVVLTGSPGTGRRFLVRQLMAHRRKSCLFADVSAAEDRPRAVEQAALVARLLDSYLCLSGLESPNAEGELETASSELIQAIGEANPGREPLFLIVQKRLIHPVRPVTAELEVPRPDEGERLALFRYYFSQIPMREGASLEELSAKFSFVPQQIQGAAAQAAGLCQIQGGTLSNAAAHRCCYRQVVHNLDKLAKRISPHFTWEDVVLPESQKRLMQQACNHIRYQHRVYQEWGFNQKIGYGMGLSILFAGAPGTGKTMCAQVIARELNMEMYKINISQIVSKYIGETEKNLQAVFQEARNSNCILFFDECDALFGKRSSEVKDAHDRNANVEVAYLLQQIEDHDGVCILATNLIQNIDAAFMRRITYVVHFPFPQAPQRKEIYLHTLPANVPVDPDVDWDFIAEQFQLSGGHIKNIVLAAAFMAASQDSPIQMRHLLTAAVNELRKNEMVVVREDLREYADLIDD